MNNPFGRTFYIINELNNNDENYILFNGSPADSLNETNCGSSNKSMTEPYIDSVENDHDSLDGAKSEDCPGTAPIKVLVDDLL